MKGENKDSWKKKRWYLLAVCGVLAVSGMVYAGNRTGKEEQKVPLVDLNEEPEKQVNTGDETDQEPIRQAEGEKTQEEERQNSAGADGKPVELAEKPDGNEETAVDKNTAREGEELAQNNPGSPDADEQADPIETTGEMVSKGDNQQEEESGGEPEDGSAAVASLTAEELSFSEEEGLLWPLSGNVIKNYSADKMVYFETLQQFRTNPAIFIAGEKGAQIVAAADGIVKEIRKEDKLGQVLVLDLGNGYQLFYGQLESLQVKAGDYVKAGAPIARLAGVTKYYQVEGDHLYFQVQKDEETINPMTLIH